MGYLLFPVLVLTLILRTGYLVAGSLLMQWISSVKSVTLPRPLPSREGRLFDGAFYQGRGDLSTVLSTKGGETFRRCFPPREGRLFDGAFHQGRGDFSTVLSTKGGETFRRSFMFDHIALLLWPERLAGNRGSDPRVFADPLCVL